VTKLPGVPATAFVNDIKADLFDANTVYVALDNHKYGDFNPYLYKSTDRGRSWRSIKGNIPDLTLVWRLVQDHVKSNLLFLATEFGIYFTIDGGGKWTKLKGGVPNISFRDLAIQKRETDLVGASFGRSFYVLDDYSVLREITQENLKAEATLFATRDAWWYVPRSIVSNQGAGYYQAPNPPFGAVFTYYLADGLKTLKDDRTEREKELTKEGKGIPFPGWDAIEAERRQEKPKIMLTVKDSNGNIVQQVDGSTKKGMHRVNWNLRYASKNAIPLQPVPQSGFGFGQRSRGMLATPGTYTVTLSKQVDGKVTMLSAPVSFVVKPLRKGALEGASYSEYTASREELENLQGAISAASFMLNNNLDKVKAMETALSRLSTESSSLVTELYKVKQSLLDLDQQMNRHRSKQEIGERSGPTVSNRMFVGIRGMNTTYGPTKMHKESMAIASSQFANIKNRLEKINDQDIPALEKSLIDAGAPYIEGQAIPKN